MQGKQGIGRYSGIALVKRLNEYSTCRTCSPIDGELAFGNDERRTGGKAMNNWRRRVTAQEANYSYGIPRYFRRMNQRQKIAAELE